MQTQRLFAIAAGLIMAVAIIATIFRNTEPPLPSIESASTEQSETDFTPRPVTTIVMSKDVEDNFVRVVGIPRFDASIEISGNTITISPKEDLADGTPYKIGILWAPSEEDGPKEAGVHEFRTNEFTERREFLDSLPQDFGAYSVTRVSERVLYVPVRENIYSPAVENNILEFLSEKGISSPEYRIDIDPVGSSLTTDGINH